MALKDAHVMRVEKMIFLKTKDKKSVDRLEIHYYDVDANILKEYFYLNNIEQRTAFLINFIRMHNRLPETPISIKNVEDVLHQQVRFRSPLFIIARKKDRFWNIREKIFA